MRKFLFILSFLSMVQAASALDLSFWIGNTKITPGETVQFTDIIVDTYPDYKEVTMKPSLYLMADMYSSDVVLKATCTSGQVIQVCTNGKCRSGESVTVSDFVLRPNQKLDIGYDYITELDLTDPIPTVVTTIEAEDPTEPGSKVEFVIEMSDGQASISEVRSANKISANADGIAYSADGVTRLQVTNILGVNYCSREVSGEGFIALPKGLYIYRLGDKAGKIYVR